MNNPNSGAVWRLEPTYLVADLFCGAGGTSTGAKKAMAEVGAGIDLVAVNHWPVAVETHQLNHPTARHYVQDLDGADPEALVPEGRLDLLMASPECRYYSRARGGKPIHDQGRMNPWIIQRWLTSLDVRCVLLENVPEFTGWGPLDEDGRPDKSRKGLYFQEWVRSFWGLGYEVEWRMLNAADYGEATSRVRFFLQARKDGEPIRWPEATHSKSGEGDMLGDLPRWRGAREIIDWSNPGRSLMDDPKYRKKPLSVNTRRRIARGLERFGGLLAPLYIGLLDLPAEVPDLSETSAEVRAFHGSNRQNTAPRGMEEPVPTLTTWGNGGAYMVQPVVEPFIGANRNNNVPRGIDQPVPVITTAGGGGCYKVEPTAEPFVLGQQSGGAPRMTDEPIPTVTGDGAISLVQPLVAEYYGRGEARSVYVPLTTVTTKARHGLAMPTLAPVDQERDEGADDEGDAPAPAVHACVVPNFGERDGQEPRVHDIDEPVPTVTSRGAGNLVSPVLAEMALEQISEADIDPRRLVFVDGQPYLLDIRYRMLQNPELARAMAASPMRSGPTNSWGI